MTFGETVVTFGGSVVTFRDAGLGAGARKVPSSVGIQLEGLQASLRGSQSSVTAASLHT